MYNKSLIRQILEIKYVLLIIWKTKTKSLDDQPLNCVQRKTTLYVYIERERIS